MMTGGPGWGELFMQDPITKEKQKVGVVEELTTQCLKTEYCVVTDNWLSYNMYDEWIERNFPNHIKDFVFEHDHGDIQPDRLYKIIGKAPHLESLKTMLYLIQDMDTEQVFIMEEDGIKKTVATNISMKNTNTIYCDDNLDAIQYIGDAILSKDAIREICKEYIEEKEKKEMDNKIVDLYYERKNEEIKNKYVELLKKEYEELDVVKEYNELVNTFEASLAELAGRYNTEETRVLVKTGYTDTYTYELNSDLKDTLKDAHREEYDKEVNALKLLVEEVRAVLSVSDDDAYRIGVLTEYGIITKKGKLNV